MVCVCVWMPSQPTLIIVSPVDVEMNYKHAQLMSNKVSGAPAKAGRAQIASMADEGDAVVY